MAKIIGGTTATNMPIPDWNQTDPQKADYIKNKPDVAGKQEKFGEVVTDQSGFRHVVVPDGTFIESGDGFVGIQSCGGAPVGLNNVYFFKHESGGYIDCVFMPPHPSPNTAANVEYVDQAVAKAGGGGSIPQEVLDAKQDKFADVTDNGYGDKTLSLACNTRIQGNLGIVINNLDENGNQRGEFALQNLQLVSAENKAESAIINLGMVDYDKCAATKGYVDTSNANKQDKFADVFTSNGQAFVNIPMNTRLNGHGSSGGTPISNIADPVYPQDVTNKRYVDGLVGDIESTLDSVIAIQNALIGGDA